MSEIRRLSPHYRNGGELPEATMAASRALRDAIPSLSDEQVYARMAEVLGTLDANHTLFRSFPQPGRERFERFLPVTFYAFPEGLFVVRAEPEARALIGQRLVAIDSVPADEAFRRIIRAHSAGAASELYWTAPQRLSESRLLHGLGIARSSTRVTLTLADARGRTSRHVLNAGAADNFGKLGPPPGIAPPLFLSRPDEAHWFQAWPDMSSIYVQVNQIGDDPDETMAQFGIGLRRALAERPARNLVLDLRRNNGGNTFTYVELLRTLIAFSAQEGNRLYVILGRTTYSAAANLATDLERLANPVFVGEPSGDFGNQEGDEGQIVLPYSQWSASVGAVWWQVSHPWDRRRFIAPQVPAQLTAQAYFAGQDPVLEAVRALIRMN